MNAATTHTDTAIAAVRSSSLERDGIRYELSELLPDDYAERTFSEMFEAGDDTSPDGMRDDAIDGAMVALGFYVPEEPLVLLANLPTDEPPDDDRDQNS